MAQCLCSNIPVIAATMSALVLPGFVYHVTRKTWQQKVRKIMAIYTVQDDAEDGTYMVLSTLDPGRLNAAVAVWRDLEGLRT